MRPWIALLGGAVIAAAFLGPGTITTAARAGSAHRLELVWALAFATVACLVLQEASARLTIVTGRSLGEALRRRFTGPLGDGVVWLVAGAVLLGCAAYEAGNILGGVAGIELFAPGHRTALTLLSAALAALLLGLGSTGQVVAVLSALVALMGLAFFATALRLAPPAAELTGGLLPEVPAGSGLLVLGLVGTTVVPYNLFLGSGLARGQDLARTRLGLALAIVLGGVISLAVMVVGSVVVGSFGFEELGRVLGEELGPWAPGCFGVGLFAAGFSSAVTAPLAAAITARGLFDRGDDPAWRDDGKAYRAVWATVLLCGALFGVTGVRPVPAILAAQALNGLLLPVVALFLWLVMNDTEQLGERTNGPLQNVLLGTVVLLTVLLGMRGLGGVVQALFG
jgi:Mn2+/Fe2+ NRAMP family transporter